MYTPMIIWIIPTIYITLRFLNWLSYQYFKDKVIKSRRWDLNICCGKTDGGGINADIIRHANIPNLILVKDIYHLPFKNKQFDTILCSHTIEHVDKPRLFFSELQRVGKDITLITPPLWDLLGSFNFLAHKWIVFSVRKIHKNLPVMIPYPLGTFYSKIFGQIIKA